MQNKLFKIHLKKDLKPITHESPFQFILGVVYLKDKSGLGTWLFSSEILNFYSICCMVLKYVMKILQTDVLFCPFKVFNKGYFCE